MSPQANSTLLPGFCDYGIEANAVFRTCLDAMSRPGRIYPFDVKLAAPDPLWPTSAAVLLTLADYETTCWLDSALAERDEIRSFLRFHTSMRFTAAANEADFAVIADVAEMPKLRSFKLGTPEFPDRSTTLLVQVDELVETGLRFSGPGIDGKTSFSCDPMPANFKDQLIDNRSAFPCGVDLMFVTPAHIAALPRSVTLMSEA